MEPRRDDGDDAYIRNEPMSYEQQPQWSPVVTTGTTGKSVDLILSGHDQPQWSPVVTTGTT